MSMHKHCHYDPLIVQMERYSQVNKKSTSICTENIIEPYNFKNHHNLTHGPMGHWKIKGV